jgi:hypothetical protein
MRWPWRRKPKPPKHEHQWGKWYPSLTYHSYDVRRCQTCGRREERSI